MQAQASSSHDRVGAATGPPNNNLRVLQRGPLFGERGPFQIVQGCVASDLLAWLQDAVVDMDCPEWSFEKAPAKHMFVENGCKLEIIGQTLSDTKLTNCTIFGRNAGTPQDKRLRAFRKAFIEVNKPNITIMERDMRKALAKLSPEELGQNGRLLMEEGLAESIACRSSVQLMAPGGRTDPQHFDGGPSFFHCGLTLFGQRRVHLLYDRDGDGEDCDSDSVRDVLSMTCVPGHFYFGTLCSAKHWVQHEADDPILFNSKSLGNIRVVVLFRSKCFRQTRASTMKAGPNPKECYKAASESVTRSLCTLTWRMPSLQDCQTALGTG